MRLATWNVNSIRTRVDRVVAFLERSGTDVLAMQEIKCRPDQFPREAFEAAGYELAIHGLDQWNGVAIASRIGLDEVADRFVGQPPFGKPGKDEVVEARAIGATCAGVRVWSLYIPNGRALDDPHYAYKLAFLGHLRDAAEAWASTPTALVGDWNVAPLDADVWDTTHPDLATHVAPDIREAFDAVGRSGFEEVTRRFLPADHTYTYWDYQQLRFVRDEGMRIDFVYASAGLDARALSARIDRDERKGAGASDHVPVIVDFADAPGTVGS